jgi:hypothetical protein
MYILFNILRQMLKFTALEFIAYYVHYEIELLIFFNKLLKNEFFKYLIFFII